MMSIRLNTKIKQVFETHMLMYLVLLPTPFVNKKFDSVANGPFCEKMLIIWGKMRRYSY